MRLEYWVGLGGVCRLERKSVRIVGKVFESLIVLVGVLLLCQWQFELFKLLSPAAIQTINIAIWLFFIVTLIMFLMLVEDRPRFLKENWLIPLVVLIDIPLIFTPDKYAAFYLSFKPILALLLFVPWLGLLKHSLMDNRLGTTIISAIVVVCIAGVLISGVDPGIKNPAEGVWWAWVTMSTVGFGDLVPVTFLGRLVASLVILIGLCFFAILTANFSSMFIRRDVSQFSSREEKDIERVTGRIRDVEARDRDILRTLERIEKRLDELEKK